MQCSQSPGEGVRSRLVLALQVKGLRTQRRSPHKAAKQGCGSQAFGKVARVLTAGPIYFLRQGLPSHLWLVRNTVRRQGWPQTCTDLPVSASRAWGLKGMCHRARLFCFESHLRVWRSLGLAFTCQAGSEETPRIHPPLPVPSQHWG